MKQKKFTNSLNDALTNFWTDYTGWGRATRSEYWWAYLFYTIFASCIISILHLEILEPVWWLATIVPGFCLVARRLHDTGRSNWNACWILLPIIGWIILIVYFCQPSQKKSNQWGKPKI